MAWKTAIFLCLILVETIVVHGEDNNITSENLLKTRYGCSPHEEWSLLKYDQGIIPNVCLKNDYVKQGNRDDASILFYHSKVKDVDEMGKTITMIIKLYSSWNDPGVIARISSDADNIVLPSVTTEHPPKLWTPFGSIVIWSLIERQNILDPMVMSDLGLTTSKSMNQWYGKQRFPPNTTIICAAIQWRVTVSCNFDFSNFPFDRHNCEFRMYTLGINISLDSSPDISFKQLNDYDATGFAIKMKPFVRNETTIVGTSKTSFGFDVGMKRQVRKYFFQYFLPSFVIVIASSFGFIIPLSAIPGRVALVVTQFLTLTNIFINQMVRYNELVY